MLSCFILELLKKVMNTTIKKIVSDIIAFVSSKQKVLDPSAIFDFIDLKPFSERKMLGFILKFDFSDEPKKEKNYNVKKDLSIMIKKEDGFYSLNLDESNFKIYFKFVGEQLQVSFNSYYWENVNLYTLIEALELIYNNVQEQALYIKQKNNSVPFILYIKDITKYKSLDKIIEY